MTPTMTRVAATARELLVRPRQRIADEVVRLEEVAIAHTRDVVVPRDGERRPRPVERRAGDLPAAERILQRRFLTLPERQIVDVVDVQHVAPIEARGTPEA